jgi:hypothetical protein
MSDRQFAAFVEGLDHVLGRLRDALDAARGGRR